MLLVDGAAEKAIAVKHPNLGKVPRVVPNGHRLTYVGGEDWIEISQSLEMEAVAPHDSLRGDRNQQKIESFQTLRNPWHPSIAYPRDPRDGFDLLMLTDVVIANYVRADGGIERGQGQLWRARRFSCSPFSGYPRLDLRKFSAPRIIAVRILS